MAFSVLGRGGTETEMRQIPQTVPIYLATGQNVPSTVQAYLAAQARAQAEAQARMPNRRRLHAQQGIRSHMDQGCRLFDTIPYDENAARAAANEFDPSIPIPRLSTISESGSSIRSRTSRDRTLPATTDNRNRTQSMPPSPVASNDDAGAGTTGIGNGPVIPGPPPASYGVTRTNSGSRRLHGHETSSGRNSGEAHVAGNVGRTSTESMREKLIPPVPGAIPAPAIPQQPLGIFRQFTQRMHRRNSNSNPAPRPPAPVIPHDHSRTHSHFIPRPTLAIIPPPLFVPPPPTEHRVRHHVSFINPNQRQAPKHAPSVRDYVRLRLYYISRGPRSHCCRSSNLLRSESSTSPISVRCKPSDSVPTSKSKTDALPADILSEPATEPPTKGTLQLVCERFPWTVTVYGGYAKDCIARTPRRSASTDARDRVITNNDVLYALYHILKVQRY
ncbi:hypothetical protein BT96DRAFT_1098208 [Gymnopus androsaceus JB14]|uniref:DUF6699 domain-containing protein n=1 Tax=Gymnopus androsaceus JB14 TaxID=1447944 RepID=A0A6A4HUB9_9AGAR|nr:hypothetical protein BT96DRAFT_1098208 [Gymnopus androsaceus JB14]